MKTPLTLYLLLYAIAEVKTAFGESVPAPSKGAGVLLLPPWLVHDVNTFTSRGYRLADRVLDDVAFEMAVAYMKHYGAIYEKRYGVEASEKELVLILHYGWEKCLETKGADPEGIWRKVKKELGK